MTTQIAKSVQGQREAEAKKKIKYEGREKEEERLKKRQMTQSRTGDCQLPPELIIITAEAANNDRVSLPSPLPVRRMMLTVLQCLPPLSEMCIKSFWSTATLGGFRLKCTKMTDKKTKKKGRSHCLRHWLAGWLTAPPFGVIQVQEALFSVWLESVEAALLRLILHALL